MYVIDSSEALVVLFGIHARNLVFNLSIDKWQHLSLAIRYGRDPL